MLPLKQVQLELLSEHDGQAGPGSSQPVIRSTADRWQWQMARVLSDVVVLGGYPAGGAALLPGSRLTVPMIILPVFASRKIQFLFFRCRCGKASQLYPYAS